MGARKTEEYLGFKVSEDNLLPFLSPTSPGTNWFDPPPENVTTERGVGRMILQFHQLTEYLLYTQRKFGSIRFLDIGTGNGMLPNLVADYLGADEAVGLDPYEDGEHTTSWAKNTRNGFYSAVKECLSDEYLDINKYKDKIQYEEFYRVPDKIKYRKKKTDWKFEKQFLENYKPSGKFNIIFAKCIDHIHDWESLFGSAFEIAEENSLMIIKHNSYFGFNGAHRYASTYIPWGHVLLKEEEYEVYSQKYHGNRSSKMIDFYYNGLSYKRKTLTHLISILHKSGWLVRSIDKSIGKDMDKKIKLAGGTSRLHESTGNTSEVGLDELLSGELF